MLGPCSEHNPSFCIPLWWYYLEAAKTMPGLDVQKHQEEDYESR